MGIKNYTHAEISRALAAGVASEIPEEADFAAAALYYYDCEAPNREREHLRRAICQIATALRGCDVIMAMELLYRTGGWMSKYSITGKMMRNEVVEYAARKAKEEISISYRKRGHIYR